MIVVSPLPDPFSPLPADRFLQQSNKPAQGDDFPPGSPFPLNQHTQMIGHQDRVCDGNSRSAVLHVFDGLQHGISNRCGMQKAIFNEAKNQCLPGRAQSYEGYAILFVGGRLQPDIFSLGVIGVVENQEVLLM